MAQETLERIVEDVKTLTMQERQQLRAFLEQGGADKAEDIEVQERQLLQHLLEKGIIGNIPSGLHSADSRDRHAPIDVKGRPVSEILLEDRE